MSMRFQYAYYAAGDNPSSQGVKYSIYLEKTDGTPYTGLTATTQGLVCYSLDRGGSYKQAITLIDHPINYNFESGTICEIDSVNLPGWYRFDVLGFGMERCYVFSGAVDMERMVFQIYTFAFNIKTTNPQVTLASTATLPSVGFVQNISNIESMVGLQLLDYGLTADARLELAIDVANTIIAALSSKPALQLPPPEEV